MTIKHNKLTPLKFLYRKKYIPYWEFICECGNTKIASLYGFRQNLIRSCGCLNKRKNYKGMKFGKLTAIHFIKMNETSHAVWLFKCECGNEKEFEAHSIVSGNRKSCDCIGRGHNRLPFGYASLKKVYNTYKYSAIKRKILFNLTIENLQLITSGNCYYCNRLPSNEHVNEFNRGNYKYNGIDRVNNNLGYTLDNTVPCCKFCNIAKNNMSIDNFKTLIINIYKNWIKND